jgi:tetratricopeptide (TPR) repeat protein
MKFQLLLAGLAMLSCSCTRHTPVVNGVARGLAKPVQSRAPTAPTPTVWERQVKNAVDAGDGDYELRRLREIVAAEPGNIPARLDLAAVYRQRGFPDVALEVTRLAAARFPESGEVELALVRSLRDLNRRTEATEGLEAFLKAHSQTAPEYYSWLGILRDESGLWPAGEPAHRQAVELSPNLDYLHNNLGYNLLMQKKNDEAAEEFRTALKLNPKSQVARNNLGLVLANQDAAEQAVASFQAVSDPATAHNNLAAVYLEKGNYPAARKELGVALSYNKTHPAALKNLELVGRMDGQAATRAGESAAPPRWTRWKIGFRRLFVGPLEDSQPEAARTVSAK